MPFRRETWHSEPARWAYILVVIASACAMAVLFVMINNDRNEIKREANVRAAQIQQQRYDATFAVCTEQNMRHKQTIDHLHDIEKTILEQTPTAKAKQRIRQSIGYNIVLIDALVPKRNCKTIAKQAVHPLINPNGR